MSTQAQPHTSAALKHLRFGVTVASVSVCLALVVQMLVFGVVNYTDWRFAPIQASEHVSRPADATVIQADPGAARRRSGREGVPVAGPRATAAEIAAAPNVNTIYTEWDVWLRHAHHLAMAVGTVCIIILSIQMALSVPIAALANSPGIDKVVAAQTWSLIVLGLTVPWQKLVPDAPYAGLFSNYFVLVADADAFRESLAAAPSALVFYGRYFLLPMAALAGIMTLSYGFRYGVERAIISGPSVFEQAIEAEAANRAATSHIGAGRVGAALNTVTTTPGGPVVGEATSIVTPEYVGAVIPQPAPVAPPVPPAAPRPITEPSTGEPPLRRPI